MNLGQSLLLGVIEGVTEFLPISSTFHLLWAMRLLSIPQTAWTDFWAVFIQGAAILAVLVLFWRTWLQDTQVLVKVGASFVPTAVIAFLLRHQIKTVFFYSPLLMLSVFAGVGVIFFGLEWLQRRGRLQMTKTLSHLSWKHAILIGIIQAVAVIPGVSRAGAVIVGMMCLGYRRDEAAKYSFLLAVPTLGAAAGFDMLQSLPLLLASDAWSWVLLGAGSVSAFLSALVVVQWFIGFLRSRSLNSFGWYRVIVALLLSVLPW